MENKKVGIVIPSYNQGRYLERAIKSVIENKQYADVRIAVMDGGSQDDSVEIIKRYEHELAYWCSEKDGGQADAINKGIQKLWDCDYFLWLNSDDIYETPDAVFNLVSYAVENNYEVCYGLSHFIDEDDKVIGEYRVEPFDKKTLGKRCYLSQPSVMFSKKAYEEIGPVNTELHMCMDYEYWIRLAQRFSFGYVEKYIGATRMYGETKTSTMQKRHLAEGVAILKKFYGEVPMHWVVTCWLAERSGSVWGMIPKRILMVVLMPFRQRIIQTFLRKQI